MNNKRKKPLTDYEKAHNNDRECVLVGIMIILICIIGLLNTGPIGNFLTYIGIYLFGAFYFVLYLIAIVSSIYLIVKKKNYRLHFNMKLLGSIFIFLALIIACSTSNTEIKFSNLVEVFNEHMATVSSKLFVIDSISNLPVVGGGFIGYLLKALLNTCITPIGTMVVHIIFMAIGICLLLKDPVVYLVKFFVSLGKKEEKTQERKIISEEKKETNEVNDESLEQNRQTIPNNIVPQVSTTYREFDDIKEIPQNVNEIKEEPKEIISRAPSTNTIEELEAPKKESISSKDYFADDFGLEEVKEEPKKEFFSTPSFEEKRVEEPIFQEKIEVKEEVKEEIPSSYIKEEPQVSQFKEENVETFVEPKVESKTISTPVTPKVKEEAPKKAPSNKPYQYPSYDLLKYHAHEDTKAENEFVANQRLDKINRTFQQFKIGAQVISYTIGPSVTRFNVRMNEGVRVNTLSGITNEISIALNGDKSVRLEMIVEGRDTSSIEVGNKKATPVSFKECFEAIKDRTSPKDKLLIPLGKDIENKVVTTSMDELPHLLVAGTTGSGKSVFVNTIITTFIMRNTPDELKLILVDPKKVEFTRYGDLPHLLCPIITESKEAGATLAKLCEEMDDRYAKLSLRGVSKISEYNELAEIKGFEKMSSIVLVIDEFADLLTKNAKEIEQSVQRLCQKARAAGIYLIICTQRPSVNVITGDIKAVIPSRIGLLVPQSNDSRIILDDTGAESLLGNGDMLCRIPKHSSLVRVQGAYVSGTEIALICEAIKEQREVKYDPRFCNLIQQVSGGAGASGDRKLELDELHEEAKQHVIETRIASTSNLQSYFSIGYARADHILNCLEQEGIVKRASGNRRIVVAQNETEDEE